MAAPTAFLKTPAKALALSREGVFGLVLLLTLVLGWVMALGGGGAVMLNNLYDTWALARQEQVVVYLPAESAAADVSHLQDELRVLQGVSKVEPMAQQDVAKKLAPYVSDPTSVPLPVVLNMDVKENVDRAALQQLVMQRFPLAEVDEGTGLVRAVAGSVQALQLAALGVAAAMALLMLLLVAVLVKLSLRSQQATLALLIDLGAMDNLVAKLVVGQVLARVVWGWLGASVLAVAMLAITLQKYPTLNPVVTPGVWVALLGIPASLVLVAGVVGAVTAKRMVARPL